MEAVIIKEVYTGTKFQGRKELDKLLKTAKPNDTIIFDSVSCFVFRLGHSRFSIERPFSNNIMYEGWILLMLELSETPTRSYIINALFDEETIWDD